MHELGVLGRFVPEFGRLSCKVQHDLYHRFTADVHVLHCLRKLDEVFQNKNSKFKHYLEALRKNEVPGLLYLILFLHDLGKDQGPKGHCERGVEIAHGLMDRLGISDEMHDRILFVIRNHLEMTRYANKFDLEDPEVIDSFAQFIEGEQRLRFLYVHTFCDANATAPPEPPSPIIIETSGTLTVRHFSIVRAIASACPRSSAPFPGKAPGVSTKVIMGSLNRFAMSIRRTAFR